MYKNLRGLFVYVTDRRKGHARILTVGIHPLIWVPGLRNPYYECFVIEAHSYP